jgi:hypothetical protein
MASEFCGDDLKRLHVLIDTIERGFLDIVDQRDELAAKLRELKWAVCESEVLHDPKLSGRARELLTEIANLSSV